MDLNGMITTVGSHQAMDTTSIDNRKSKDESKAKRIELCRVCEGIATGTYFGALVCVPCKTFFLRYSENNTFSCKQGGVCEVTVSSRTQCKSCRMNKCFAVGMCRKDRPTQVFLGEGQQQCVVCHDVANGYHFGAMTCEGCKKFFRRGLTEHDVYVCRTNETCVINPRTRNACRYCRYQKCLQSGMCRENIQMGRPVKIKRSGEGGRTPIVPPTFDDSKKKKRFDSEGDSAISSGPSNGSSPVVRSDPVLKFEDLYSRANNKLLLSFVDSGANNGFLRCSDYLGPGSFQDHEIANGTNFFGPMSNLQNNQLQLQSNRLHMQNNTSDNYGSSPLYQQGAFGTYRNSSEQGANAPFTNFSYPTEDGFLPNETVMDVLTSGLMVKEELDFTGGCRANSASSSSRNLSRNSVTLSRTSSCGTPSNSVTPLPCHAVTPLSQDGVTSSAYLNYNGSVNGHAVGEGFNNRNDSSSGVCTGDVNSGYWLHPTLPNEDIEISDYLDLLKDIVGAYSSFVKKSESINVEMNNRYKKMISIGMNEDEIMSCIQKTIHSLYTKESLTYFKEIPGFTGFNRKDQFRLVRLGQSQSRILVAAVHWYDPSAGNFRDFLAWRNSKFVFKQHLIEFAKLFSTLQLDDNIECALLNALVIIATDYPDLENSHLIEKTRLTILKTFRAYTTAKYGSPNLRIETLFKFIPKLRELGYEHHYLTFDIQLSENASQ